MTVLVIAIYVKVLGCWEHISFSSLCIFLRQFIVPTVMDVRYFF